MSKPIAYDVYQELADSYSELVPKKDYNAYYDRPAVLSLLDDISGKAVLDAGCGPGVYTEILLERRAVVTGIDVSERMLFHARQRNGDKARFIPADMGKPLTFLKNNEFDGILSALAVTYIEDLGKLFGEFFRILKPGGWIVFSTEHPFFSYRYFDIENYFETQRVSCTWGGFGTPVTMHSYYHSLGHICDSLTASGFVISRVLEPKPVDEFKNRNPKAYEERMRFPSFIHFKAMKCAQGNA